MSGWVKPALFGALVAAASCYAGIVATSFGIMEIAVRRISAASGLNQMAHGELATPERQPIVRPSPDLAYSSCPYDLTSGPLIITVAPVAGRYQSLSVFDARTDVIFVRNDIAAKAQTYRIVLARPGQAVPAGAQVVRTQYNRGIALIRLLLKEPAELQALDAARRQSTCATILKSG